MKEVHKFTRFPRSEKKRRLNLTFKFSNRILYSLITVFILAIIGVGVYAYANPTTGVGHDYSELQPCGANQILQTNAAGTAWTCAAAGGGGGSSQWSGTTDIYYTGGKVGIGTTSPLNTLDVNSVSKATGIRLGNGNEFTYDIGRDGGDGLLYFHGNQAGANGFVFEGAGTPTEKMRITSDGKVGIGTAEPGAKLEVNGNLKVNGVINGIRIMQQGSSDITMIINRICNPSGSLIAGSGICPNRLLWAPSGTVQKQASDCTAISGAFVRGFVDYWTGESAQICVIPGNSCPSGWTQYKMSAVLDGAINGIYGPTTCSARQPETNSCGTANVEQAKLNSGLNTQCTTGSSWVGKTDICTPGLGCNVNEFIELVSPCLYISWTTENGCNLGDGASCNAQITAMACY